MNCGSSVGIRADENGCILLSVDGLVFSICPGSKVTCDPNGLGIVIDGQLCRFPSFEEGGVVTGMSFDPETNVLTLSQSLGEDVTVDLSALASSLPEGVQWDVLAYGRNGDPETRRLVINHLSLIFDSVVDLLAGKRVLPAYQLDGAGVVENDAPVTVAVETRFGDGVYSSIPLRGYHENSGFSYAYMQTETPPDDFVTPHSDDQMVVNKSYLKAALDDIPSFVPPAGTADMVWGYDGDGEKIARRITMANFDPDQFNSNDYSNWISIGSNWVPSFIIGGDGVEIPVMLSAGADPWAESAPPNVICWKVYFDGTTLHKYVLGDTLADGTNPSENHPKMLVNKTYLQEKLDDVLIDVNDEPGTAGQIPSSLGGGNGFLWRHLFSGNVREINVSPDNAKVVALPSTTTGDAGRIVIRSGAATANTVVARDASGRVMVADANAVTQAVTLGQLNGRLSAAARTAINALTPVAADPTPAELASAYNALLAALKAT